MNAGRVELDLVAVGKDQVSAMLRQVDAQLKKTAGEMGKTGAAAASAGSQTASLGEKLGASMKASVGPLDKVRSGFELVRSNAMFLTGGIGLLTGIVTGAVAAFVEFATGADKGAAATRQWEKDLKGFNAAVDGAWKALDRSKTSPVEDALSAVNSELGKAKLTLVDIEKNTAEWWDKTRQLRNMEEARAALMADMSRETKATLDHIRGLYGTMKDLSDLAPVQLFKGTSADPSLTMGRNPNTGEVETDEMRVAREKRLADAIKRNPARKGGSGSAQDPGKAFDEEVKRQRALAERSRDVIADTPGRAGTGGSSGSTSSGGNGSDGALTRMATDAEKVRDALHQVADAIGLVSAEFPELGNALSEVSAISDQFAAGQATLAEALAAGGVAIVANAAKAVGGVKAEAAVRAAYEVGMGFATLTNPVESAGHFTAAALLGAVAAGAGGGGGKKSASSGSGAGFSGGSGSSGGPTTIVNNFAMGIGDRQTITLALRQSERTSRGTGASSRGGV